jgi:tungstate transport system substrate-binding protein
MWAAGCTKRSARKPHTTIRLATTTSTENSGLLDALLLAFEKRHGISVQVIAVGTGKAIRHGENGDVDAILVHARAAEEKLVADGFGVGRRDVMYNDFVLLGPAADPALVRGVKDAPAALAKIAASEAPFVSRGDDSGTHKKETALWRAAGVAPEGAWYMAAGQGMGACLTIADEKRAYVLADRGTYLAFRDKVEIDVLVEGDPRLFNPYGVIAVNPEKHPHVKHEAAMEFIEWLTSPEAQHMIAEFKRGGEQLFYPHAGEK